MSPCTLLIRADASAAIGTGHVMRCLALAQEWRAAGGEAVFASAATTAAAMQRLMENGCGIEKVCGEQGSPEDLRSTQALVTSMRPSWIVLDGYEFDTRYQAELRGLAPLLCIDDNGLLDRYSADVVVNQNVHATEAMYSQREDYTRLLLGPRYAMLRNEFVRYRNWTRTIPPSGKHLLVTMGGSDVSDFTPRILRELARLPAESLKIRVVVGGSAINRAEVEAAAAECHGRAEVLVDVRDMPELMAWADLAIAAAGSTCWEMCLLGLPAILIVAAENQRHIARQLEVEGAGIDMGTSASVDCAALVARAGEVLLDQNTRTVMSQSGRRLVDGLGRERVLHALLKEVSPCA